MQLAQPQSFEHMVPTNRQRDAKRRVNAYKLHSRPANGAMCAGWHLTMLSAQQPSRQPLPFGNLLQPARIQGAAEPWFQGAVCGLPHLIVLPKA